MTSSWKSDDTRAAIDGVPYYTLNTLRPRQIGRHFADDTFNSIFLNGNARISIEISLKFVPNGPINNTPALVQIMAWRLPATSHYLNKWWFVYWGIYASLGLNELIVFLFFYQWDGSEQNHKQIVSECQVCFLSNTFLFNWHLGIRCDWLNYVIKNPFANLLGTHCHLKQLRVVISRFHPRFFLFHDSV